MSNLTYLPRNSKTLLKSSKSTYSLNFVLLRSECPVCGGFRNGKRKWDCKQSGELIHCFSHNDPPAGYVHKGLSSIGQSLYAPKRGHGHDPEQNRAYLAQLRAEHQARQAEKRANLPSVNARDERLKRFANKLSKGQQADLLRRGLREDEIELALSRHWLFTCFGGYGIAAVDPVTNLLCGAQRALDDRSLRKYDWAIFKHQNHLQETDENPLFVWQHPDFNPDAPYQVKFCEGALKSLVRAFLEWRKHPQVIVVGAAGGQFGDAALDRVMAVYPKATRKTLLPDADSQQLRKRNLYSAYSSLAKAIPDIRFADWGQWHDKTPGDCDETYGTRAFNQYKRQAPKLWLRLFEFERLRELARERLIESDAISADITLSKDQFRALTPHSFAAMTGNAQDVFIKGGRGIGKTEKASLLTRGWERVIAPYHRQSLARNGGGRLGLTYRTDCDVMQGQLIGSDGFIERIAYCNEAYTGLSRPLSDLLEAGAGVFVDELDQQVKNLLMSSTHGKKGRRQVHLQGFWANLRQAQQTLSASADLTDFECELFKKEVGRQPFVINITAEKKPTTNTVYDTQAQWWQQFNQLRAAGQRIIICCSRKSDAKFFAEQFDAIAIHADNAAEYREFLDNPDQWLAKHKPKLLVVSPILGTGFSIEKYHFDAVLGYFFADSLTAPDLMQFLDRYRPCVPRHIWCRESNGQFERLTPEACYQARLKKANANHHAFAGEAFLINPNDPFFHYQAERNWSLAHLRADLLARLERDMETVYYVTSNLSFSEEKAIMDAVADHRRAFRQAEQTRHLNAPNLTPAEAQAMRKNKQHLSELEHYALAKYGLADWKGIAPADLTLSDIVFDDNGKRRVALERLE